VRRSAAYFGPDRPNMPVRDNTQSAQLKEIRAANREMARWSFSSQQATLRRLDTAFGAFFRRLTSGETPDSPRVTAAHRFDSVEWPTDGDGCRVKPEPGRVDLQGVGDVKVSAHRPVEGRVTTVQVHREGRRWMRVLSCDDVATRPLEPTGAAGGIDVGIASFAVTSAGRHIDNPRWGAKAAGKLEMAQHPRSKEARLGQPTGRQAHRGRPASQGGQLSARLPPQDRQGARGRSRRDRRRGPGDRQHGPAGQAAPGPTHPRSLPRQWGSGQDRVERRISDAGSAQFRSILAAKAKEAGRQMIDVDPRHTSDRCESCDCEACDHAARENRVTQAAFRCVRCGHEAHADEHAARNILRAGLALLTADQAA